LSLHFVFVEVFPCTFVQPERIADDPQSLAALSQRVSQFRIQVALTFPAIETTSRQVQVAARVDLEASIVRRGAPSGGVIRSNAWWALAASRYRESTRRILSAFEPGLEIGHRPFRADPPSSRRRTKWVPRACRRRRYPRLPHFCFHQGSEPNEVRNINTVLVTPATKGGPGPSLDPIRQDPTPVARPVSPPQCASGQGPHPTAAVPDQLPGTHTGVSIRSTTYKPAPRHTGSVPAPVAGCRHSRGQVGQAPPRPRARAGKATTTPTRRSRNGDSVRPPRRVREGSLVESWNGSWEVALASAE